MARVLLPGFLLGAVLVAFPGCTAWRGGTPGFWDHRLKDTLETADIGVTVTSRPQFSFYLAFLSIIPAGYGRVDGRFYGVGGGDFGAMDIHYVHYGYFTSGREETGWGDGLLWHFGGYDVKDPDTMNIQGVGFRGIRDDPEGRPGGRPT